MQKKKKKVIKIERSDFEKIGDRLINFILKDGDISLEKLHEVLYDDEVILEFLNIDMCCTGQHFEDLLGKMISPIEPSKSAKAVRWLYKERIIEVLGRGNRCNKYPLDDLFINIVKELLWTCYYLRLKNPRRITIFGSIVDCLSRFQGVYLEEKILDKMFNNNKQEYIINILSLKDKKYDLLPYPDQIDPADLETLMIDNDIVNHGLHWAVQSLIKDPFNPYERYHVFKFVRDIVKIHLEEKYDGVI